VRFDTLMAIMKATGLAIVHGCTGIAKHMEVRERPLPHFLVTASRTYTAQCSTAESRFN